jgi:hypothetical protein
MIILHIQWGGGGVILSTTRLERLVVGTLAMELLTSVTGLVTTALDLSDLA